jgi:ABC-type sugar transport system permease subunit
VTWVIVGTIAPIAIGLLLAMLLWRRPRGFNVFRTIFFMPQVLSAVVIGIIWSWIYNPIFGNLNKLLKAVGLGDFARGWLGDPSVALYAVLVAAIWAEVGFVFVVFLAGLQNVSKDLLEAATIDGANGWQRFKDVTVPQLSNVINVVTALLLIGGFNVFDIVFVMTGGGPANATEVIATLTYKEAFTQNRVGYASALSLVMTVVALVASVAFIRLREQREG